MTRVRMLIFILLATFVAASIVGGHEHTLIGAEVGFRSPSAARQGYLRQEPSLPEMKAHEAKKLLGSSVSSVEIASSDHKRASKNNVLLVIDMQQDYDIESNRRLYGTVKSPYASDLQSLSRIISAVRSSRSWDKVVYTQDWIQDQNTLTNPSKPFCVAGTPGSDLLPNIGFRHSDMTFTKNFDDAFNTIEDILYWQKEQHESSRGYGLKNEGKIIGARSDSLFDVLSKFQFNPEDTQLTVVGQVLDRCVLKTSMHARALGYDVIVLKNAVQISPSEKPSPGWSVSPPWNLSPITERRPNGSDGGWMQLVFKEHRAAGTAYSYGYMEKAHIRLATFDVSTSEILHQTSDGSMSVSTSADVHRICIAVVGVCAGLVIATMSICVSLGYLREKRPKSEK